MKRIGLSIDFDFWCRESPEWDWSHPDTEDHQVNQMVWGPRYLHMDLEKECDPKKHADFWPMDLLDELEALDVHIPENTPCGFSESHADAYRWFKKDPLDLIVNIDAHHDCWPCVTRPKKIGCGNWLGELPHDALVVYPKWKDPENDGHPGKRNVHFDRWSTFDPPVMGDYYLVQKVFICRSSPWVPPHLDDLFADFASMMASFTSPVQLAPILPREDINLKEMARERKKFLNWKRRTSRKLPVGSDLDE